MRLDELFEIAEKQSPKQSPEGILAKINTDFHLQAPDMKTGVLSAIEKILEKGDLSRTAKMYLQWLEQCCIQYNIPLGVNLQDDITAALDS